MVDRLTKYGHFIPLHHPFSAADLPQVYIDQIYKLHGFPSTIVSDRDKIFINLFWQSLFKLVGTKLHLSTSYHPQTDGQTERLNQVLESYLRCMTANRPNNWSTWLPLAEFWYNSHYHSGLKMTPFEALYGYKPPHLNFHQYGQIKDPTTKSFCRERTQQLQLLKKNLTSAQSRMKTYADKARGERTFLVRDWVYLMIKPYKQTTITQTKFGKLLPKYFGPYQITEKVGKVAYRLRLPAPAKVHPVFHVSLLKKKINSKYTTSVVLPQLDDHGQFLMEPVAILDRKMIKKNNATSVEVLVQWSNTLPYEAT